MTHPARITQADMDRALKAVKAAGFENARVIMDLNAATIEIIVGETCQQPPETEPNPWDEVFNR